jgi:agmatine deiminase
MVVSPGDEGEARKLLGPSVELLVRPIDDSWSRDAGPCFLVDGKGGLAGVDFRFNAWGEKYEGYDNDDRIAAQILEASGARRFSSALVAEGGGITVDGEGTLITTESCFLNPNRNPGWTKAEVERELCRLLGVSKVIWIPGDPDETETDGHVDGIAAFIRPGLVMVEVTDDPAVGHYKVLRENLAALEGQTDAKGRPLETVVIKEAARPDAASERFCLSYINAYLANGGVILPSYGTQADIEAQELFARLFPGRRVVALPIADIAPGGGGIHCITQQEPCA